MARHLLERARSAYGAGHASDGRGIYPPRLAMVGDGWVGWVSVWIGWVAGTERLSLGPGRLGAKSSADLEFESLKRCFNPGPSNLGDDWKGFSAT